ncbi:hypothetical protein [Hyphomicrobium zavarzinii]|uniref:hypothetical protein n=1 Tax=Hyphomicrobium zavarzinii TaxID=48292 RepID=UPI0003735E9F|nr:hypothetical protein [Hyphomicrobium zavarzinii]
MSNHDDQQTAGSDVEPRPLPEDSVDAVRGIVEMIYCTRDACFANGARENKPMGQGLDFLAHELARHLDVIEDALFPGRRELG